MRSAFSIPQKILSKAKAEPYGLQPDKRYFGVAALFSSPSNLAFRSRGLPGGPKPATAKMTRSSCAMRSGLRRWMCRRSDALEKRRKLMEALAVYREAPRSSKVVTFQRTIRTRR